MNRGKIGQDGPIQWRRMGLRVLHMIEWDGEMPMVGHYLTTASRRRYAYLITAIRTPLKPFAKYAFQCGCERLSLDAVPEGAHVFAFHWLKRRSRHEQN